MTSKKLGEGIDCLAPTRWRKGCSDLPTERGPTAPWGMVPLLGPRSPRLLERVDDSNALEVVESRHVFGVEDLHAHLDTCRDNQGVPQRRPTRDVQLLGAGQVGCGRQDEWQQILEFSEPVPGVKQG